MAFVVMLCRRTGCSYSSSRALRVSNSTHSLVPTELKLALLISDEFDIVTFSLYEVNTDFRSCFSGMIMRSVVLNVCSVVFRKFQDSVQTLGKNERLCISNRLSQINVLRVAPFLPGTVVVSGNSCSSAPFFIPQMHKAFDQCCLHCAPKGNGT
jgi:hypothetical protein